MKIYLSLFVILLLTACASVERTAYISVGSIGATANAAIGAYHSYVQTYGASPEQIAQAREIIQRYVEVMGTVRNVTVAYKNGTAKREAVEAASRDLSLVAVELQSILATLSIP